MDGTLKIDHDQIGRTQLLRMLYSELNLKAAKSVIYPKKGTCLSGLKKPSSGKLQKCLTPYYKDLDVNLKVI